MQLLGNMRWPLLVALAGLLLSTEVHGKAEILEIDGEGEIWVTGLDGLRRKCESDEAGTVLVPKKVQLKDTYLEIDGYKADRTMSYVELQAMGWRSNYSDRLRNKLNINPSFYYYQWYLVNYGQMRTLEPYDEPHGYKKDNPRDQGVEKGNQDFPLNINSQYGIAAILRLAAYKLPSDPTPSSVRIPEVEFRWNKRAAEYGHPEAQYQLAVHYTEGLGVEKNLPLAAKWFLKSAEEGNANAQRQVGYCYLLGRGLPRDEIEGYAYLNMASATDESLRQDVIKIESDMTVSARYAGQQRTRQLIKEIEDKKESLLKQSKESQKAREKKGA